MVVLEKYNAITAIHVKFVFPCFLHVSWFDHYLQISPSSVHDRIHCHLSPKKLGMCFLLHGFSHIYEPPFSRTSYEMS